MLFTEDIFIIACKNNDFDSKVPIHPNHWLWFSPTFRLAIQGHLGTLVTNYFTYYIVHLRYALVYIGIDQFKILLQNAEIGYKGKKK